MKSVNMHEAKTHLSRLVAAAAEGESLVITRAGKPLVKVQALEARAIGPRIGFPPHAQAPDDFDAMGRDEVAAACKES